MLPEAPGLPSTVAFLTLGSDVMSYSPALFAVTWVLGLFISSHMLTALPPGTQHLTYEICHCALAESLMLVLA